MPKALLSNWKYATINDSSGHKVALVFSTCTPHPPASSARRGADRRGASRTIGGAFSELRRGRAVHPAVPDCFSQLRIEQLSGQLLDKRPGRISTWRAGPRFIAGHRRQSLRECAPAGPGDCAITPPVPHAGGECPLQQDSTWHRPSSGGSARRFLPGSSWQPPWVSLSTLPQDITGASGVATS